MGFAAGVTAGRIWACRGRGGPSSSPSAASRFSIRRWRTGRSRHMRNLAASELSQAMARPFGPLRPLASRGGFPATYRSQPSPVVGGRGMDLQPRRWPVAGSGYRIPVVPRALPCHVKFSDPSNSDYPSLLSAKELVQYSLRSRGPAIHSGCWNSYQQETWTIGDWSYSVQAHSR